MTVNLDPLPSLDASPLASLETWLTALAQPQEAVQPVWQPSYGRATRVRSVEHLTVLMAGLRRAEDPHAVFAIIEWPRPFPQPWAQTRPSGSGLLVELNDGFVLPDREYPITRRAYRGQPGDYPMPDETDPRYRTPAYPGPVLDVFTALAGAELIWTWMTTMRLPAGIAVTMRHFGARGRAHYGGGDL